MITNAGWKAVGIGPATVQNYAQTLDIYSLTLASPVDSQNVLLLNYGGLDINTLLVRQLTMNSNTELTTLFSRLEVRDTTGGGCSIGGSVFQGDSAETLIYTMHLGDIGPGLYSLTNGVLNCAAAEYIGEGFASTFNQEGGTHTNANLNLWPSSQYFMHNGTLVSGGVQVSGTFNQSGGVVTGPLTVNGGTYNLSAGMLASPQMAMPAPFGFTFGNINQSGGTNQSDSLRLGFFGYYGDFPNSYNTYTLSGGTLATSSSALGAHGSFHQQGGIHLVQGPISMQGDLEGRNPGYNVPSVYTLESGVLSAGSITMAIATFLQSGGSNYVGNLHVDRYGGYYALSGGLLQTSNSDVQVFNQSGGVHQCTNLLTVANALYYTLSGGVLLSKDMMMQSYFNHGAGAITNTGTLSLAGTWNAGAGPAVLGRLLLSSSAALNMPAGASVVRFSDSSAMVWTNGATLGIVNWGGSPSGGGSQQIIFGNSSSALTPQQIAQLSFSNPQGYAPGSYLAKILGNGELVPEVGVPLPPTAFSATAVASNKIELRWTDNSPNETGFKIERGLDGSNFAQVVIAPANATFYTDTGLASATKYYYRLEAVGTNGNSAPAFASATTWGPVPPINLVGWWRGENSTVDAAEGNNGGWTGGGNVNAYAPGRVGSAFSFDGTHRDRVDLGNPAALRMQYFTIEAWVKRANATDISLDDNNQDGSQAGEGGLVLSYGTYGYGFGVYNDGRLVLPEIDVDGIFSTNVIADTSWHHIAVTKSPFATTFYIDGAIASEPVAYTPFGGRFSWDFTPAIAIGSRGDGRGGTFYGAIDEVAIYDGALPAQQIAAIYHAGSQGKNVPEGLTATGAGESQINLAWEEYSPDVTQFNIERATGTNFVPIASVPGNARTYSDSGLQASTVYSYRIWASGTNGNSLYSNIASTQTGAFGALPPGWSHQDVGAVGQAGNTLYYSGGFHSSGSGADIWNYHDAFQFTYRSWTGDAELVAYIPHVDNTDPWAKAGVMIRHMIVDGSPNAFMMLTPGNGSGFQWRTNNEPFDSPSFYTGGSGAAPAWVKLVRINDLFTGYVSANGSNWTQVGSQTISMTNSVLVGLAVTSHNTNALCNADFYLRLSVPGSLPTTPQMMPLARQSNGSMLVSVKGEVGRTIGVEASQNLKDWTAIGNQFNTNGTATILDSAASGLNRRFYRAYATP
jgi:hypothetical protein